MLSEQLEVCFHLEIYLLKLTIFVSAPPAGHVVNITLLYSEPVQAPGPRGKPAAPKKGKITKMDNIVMEAITRADFIKAFLRTHDLYDKYAPGVHSGPDFKFWWTGSR